MLSPIDRDRIWKEGEGNLSCLEDLVYRFLCAVLVSWHFTYERDDLSMVDFNVLDSIIQLVDDSNNVSMIWVSVLF